LTKRGSVTQREGSVYEWRASAGRNKKRCLRITLRWPAQELGRQWPVLRGLGDVPPQGFTRRSESYLRFPGNGLVRPTHPTLERRRRDVEPVGNQFNYDGVPGTHQWYDGTPHPWEFARVWHLEPSLSDPDAVLAGVEDAALFQSTDGGENWSELSGLRKQDSGASWQPGAGGCACTRSS